MHALSAPALWMSAAGLAALVIALVGGRKRFALTPICFAVPLAIFGAEHFAIAQSMAPMVPSYMPARTFWIYFVGVALLAAALSIAIRRMVEWSALLVGAMMFLFVAMLHLPGALASGGRIPWTIVFRELSFGGGAWVLAGFARNSKPLITVGRILVAVAALVFGILHFLHPLGLPGVPLEKEMPLWLPMRPVVDYVTGALLVTASLCFLLDRKTRIAAKYVGSWIVLLVVMIYGPVLIGALANPSPGVQIEGINYFADTLLFGAVILSLAGGEV